jgi:hypothetical protein
MNKDKFEVGDLVTHRYGRERDVGLVIDDDDRVGDGHYLKYGVYWFKTATTVRTSKWGITKLDKAPNE